MDNRAGPLFRKDTKVWLIGHQTAEIGGSKLPSKGDTLRNLFYYIRRQSKSLRESATIVAGNILLFWEKARIPTMAKYNIIPKVENEYEKWRLLHKSRSRRSGTQITKEKHFEEDLDNLLDVAHSDALNILKNEEDKAFLLAQREKGRKGFMTGIDTVLAKKEERKQQRLKSFELFRHKHSHSPSSLTATVQSDSSSSEECDEREETEDGRDKEVDSVPQNRRKRGRKNMVTADVASALDRTQTTDRKAVYLLASTASSMGCNLVEYAINRSTIRRERMKAREKIANDIRASFSSDLPLTVHWDGKLLPDITGTEKVDRLPVLVSGGSVTKLLGVPSLTSGTGKAQGEAVIQCLEDWNLKDRVQALSFDTTASNTGLKNGACIMIESQLGRRLLHFACRHHVMEIILEHAFSACMTQHSSGPNIQLFIRFKQKWKDINTTQFETLDDISDSENIISFCLEQLNNKHQPRDDYKELLELTCISLGNSPPKGTRFMRPGAVHRARWMGRAIYSLKICLFRAQFTLTKRELSGLLRFTRFVVSVYAKFWFLASLPASAPANDLALLKRLVDYQDKEISKTTSAAFSRHLWYLSEHLAPLAFFDTELDISIKRDMVAALEAEGSENPPVRLQLKKLSLLDGITISHFVTRNSRFFFESLKIGADFLSVDPECWSMRDDYKAAKKFVYSLKVVNDLAERGVALIQNFNSVLTKNEDQKQYLLQVVEDHRRRFSQAKKQIVLPLLKGTDNKHDL